VTGAITDRVPPRGNAPARSPGLTWAAMALAVMAWGPGRASLDALVSRAGR